MAKYELEQLRLPKLSGGGLRTFSGLLGHGFVRRLMMPRLLQDGGFPKLHEAAVEDAPTMAPIAFVPEGGRENGPLGLAQLDVGELPRQDGLPFHTIRDYVEAYRDGKSDPVAVAEKLIAALDADAEEAVPLRALIAYDKADIVRQAEASRQRLVDGTARSVLEGVPIAIKDEIDQVPYPTTVGTAFWGTKPATSDSTVVARLRAAGALLFGKANMHEIGINPTGSNVHYGMTRNPYQLDRDTGGSSSGSAAAVASGLCPVAIGADGGGSIRIPAGLCGVVGLKPTYGRVSEHGAAPLCWSVAHLGPIAATAEDAALVYAVIAGADPADPNTLHQPPPASLDAGPQGESLDGLRIGVYRPWYEHASADIVAACDALLEQFTAQGATIVPIEIPMLDEMRIAHAATILSEMAASMRSHDDHFWQMAPEVQINLWLGRSLSSFDYIKSQRMRTKALQIFAELFEQVDVIATPGTAITAPPIPAKGAGGWSDLSSVTEVMRYVFPGNLTGLPAITFPVGYDGAGLPMSMQLMAAHWREALLLQMAQAAEAHVTRQAPLRCASLLSG